MHLVEREQELGGALRHLFKLSPTDHAAVELLEDLTSRVRENGKITVHLDSEVTDVTGFIGNFNARLRTDGQNDDIEVGTVIVATGADELKPQGQYGYGSFPNVITQLELESELKAGTFTGQKVVMINCVGARVPERTYCSRFCCMTAVKNATLIKERDPGAKVWVLHRDIMAYGVDFERLYRSSTEIGVRYIRYDLAHPPQVIGDEQAQRVVVRHELMRREIHLVADVVVLTTPLIPHGENEAISKMLKVPLSEQGFFLEAHLKLRPVEFATDGVYICGSARWPTDLSEGISQAYAAASKATIPMRQGFVRPEASTAVVDVARCAGCGICANMCAYQAIELIEQDDRIVSSVNKALCKGCGTCVASCLSGVLVLNHYSDVQILAQIGAMLGSPL